MRKALAEGDMKTTIVVLCAPRALAIPGHRGGPAVYASQILTIVFISCRAASSLFAGFGCNDNGGAAA